MKRPSAPAPLDTLLERHRDRLPVVFAHGFRPVVDGRYLHWDKLRRLVPPAGLTREEWWTGVRLSRFGLSHPLPLHDVRGRPFTFMLPDRVQEGLHRIDSRAHGRIGIGDEVVSRETRDRFIMDSLIREAITSSQLEGAATTRAVATRMLRTGRRPRTRDERMILNNYRALQAVREMKNEPLTVAAVLALHETVTRDTLADPDAAGRPQRPADERVTVVDARGGLVLHRPPPAESLPARMEAMVRFAEEGLADGAFLHPVVQAVVLHFWLAYDHPFDDGNGRTARALFYWALLRRGYWMFEFVSISRFLKDAPAQYARAFLETETDANDLTYFVAHQIDVIRRALDALDLYVAEKVEQVRRVEGMLRRSSGLNHRQLALLAHALRHAGAEYTVRSHGTSHGVAYATARADLFRLAELGWLDHRRVGRRDNVFSAPSDLDVRIGKSPAARASGRPAGAAAATPIRRSVSRPRPSSSSDRP